MKEVISATKERMEKCITALSNELASIGEFVENFILHRKYSLWEMLMI